MKTPRPEEGAVVGVRLPPELIRQIDRKAKQDAVTRSHIIRQVVRRHFLRHKKTR